MKNFIKNYLFNSKCYYSRSFFDTVNIMTLIWVCFTIFLVNALIDVFNQDTKSVSDWLSILLALFMILIETQPAVTEYRKDNQTIDKILKNSFFVLAIIFLSTLFLAI